MKHGKEGFINLDHASTTPCDPELFQKVFSSGDEGNPSNTHSAMGRKAAKRIKKAKEKIARVFDCSPEEIIYTSCSTESMNYIIQGLVRHFLKRNPTGVFVTSPVEHKCVLGACEMLVQEFPDRLIVEYLPVDSLGMFYADDLDRVLQKYPREMLIGVSLIGANNETGNKINLSEFYDVCRRHRIPFCPDLTQYARCFSLKSGGQFDATTVSGHKINGIKQSAIMYISLETREKIQPLWKGGGQEGGWRSGTENVCNIEMMAACLNKIQSRREEKNQRLEHLRTVFLDGLQEADLPFFILGDQDPGNRLPCTLLTYFDHPDFCNLVFIKELDKRNVACSIGSACNTTNKKPSHVLEAMGFQTGMYGKVIRFSFGDMSTMEDVLEAIPRIVDSFHKTISKKQKQKRS